MTATLFIDGVWRAAAEGGVFPVIDPATEETIVAVSLAGQSDVDAAVFAARSAFDESEWTKFPGAQRAAILRRIADIIRLRREELATLEVRDNGKPIAEARWDIDDAAGCFDFYAGLAESGAPDEPIALGDARFSSRAVREPVGVVAAIIPWNYPMLLAAWKVAPALAAGCTVVLKPSELTPLTAIELVRIAADAGVPAGVLNLLTGYGDGAGQPLAQHTGVDKIAFTGSVPTGAKLMAVAAQDIKRISLELGGKSPFVVFADSDVEQAVEWIMFGVFWNQGQVCSATSRVLIERSLYAPLLARLAEAAAQIWIGGGLDPKVKLGPIVSASQHAKIVAAIEDGVRSGARLVSGGRRPAGLDKGYFIEPTIFADAPIDSSLWRDEVFGPVLCVRPFDSEDEAVRLANDSRYGLAAAVMSADADRAERVARRLRAGIVWINCSQPTFVEAPWGGYKQSGIGRELGRWGFEACFETKQITRYDSDAPWGWYLGTPGDGADA
ncbi:aldehyde dehydrogenase family protein [Terrarubrum flagellatum]|uniref:aldehyde dehydrogenase family protein n=1 Tax=Terrirubrum flagellatum TaxID=2895980 RepID=UPI00314501FB